MAKVNRKQIRKGRDFKKDKHQDGLRKAKPHGYRFTGKNNYRRPTAKEIESMHAGKRSDVYFEGRPERSDNTMRAKSGERFKKGGKVARFFNKAKELSEKGIAATKAGFGKAKDKVKGKIHDHNKKIALKVIGETENKIYNTKYKKDLKKSGSLVNNFYKKGGKVNRKSKRTAKAIKQDKSIKALKAGKRTSAAGNTYFEYRDNRSDSNRTLKFAKGGYVGLENIIIKPHNCSRAEFMDLREHLSKYKLEYKTTEGASKGELPHLKVVNLSNKKNNDLIKWLTSGSWDFSVISANESEKDKHLDELYKKAGDNVFGALELYAGELGIYNMYYGEKVDANKKAKYERAHKYLLETYRKGATHLTNVPRFAKGGYASSYASKLKNIASEINKAIKNKKRLFYGGDGFATFNNEIVNIIVAKEYGMDELYVITKDGKKINAGSTIFTCVFDEKANHFGKDYDEYKKGGKVNRKRSKLSIKMDKDRKALHAGKRTSAAGNTYYEYRDNRSDVNRRLKFKKGGKVNRKSKRTAKAIKQDKSIKALHSGKRESVNGNIYYEYRENRSDKNRTAKYAKGGKIVDEEWLITLKGVDGFFVDEIVFAEGEDKAMDKAEKLHKGSKTFGATLLTDKYGKEVSYKKGGKVKRTAKAIKQDKSIKALHAGKRESKNGNTYYEYRDNRSDVSRRDKFKKGGKVNRKRSKLSIKMDKDRKALHAGKRTSAAGNTYYEYRDNRSDVNRRLKFEKGGKVNRKSKRTAKAIKQDKSIKALKAGKRVSAEGNTYYEYRDNRSDKDRKLKFKKGGAVKRTKLAIAQDKRIKAKKAGKRVSAEGNTYYEYRENRSDKNLRDKFEEGGEFESFDDTPLKTFKSGGKIKKLGFKKLSQKVAKEYVGKKVDKKYQAEYGKTYDKFEAAEVGDRVAATVYAGQKAKKLFKRKK